MMPLLWHDGEGFVVLGYQDHWYAVEDLPWMYWAAALWNQG